MEQESKEKLLSTYNISSSYFFYVLLKDLMNLFNLQRESHKIHHKKISDQLDGITKWIQSVAGNNEQEAIAFIEKHLVYLNNNTKKSIFEHILDITHTRLQDENKQNDLMLLINELCNLKQQIKFL